MSKGKPRARLGSNMSKNLGRALGLRSRAGRVQTDRAELFESLEGRVLLAGDHVSFPDFAGATLISGHDADGRASDTGVLTVGDDDLFRISVPTRDFVSIQADGMVGDTVDTFLEIYDSSMNQIGAVNNDPGATGGTVTSAWFGDVLDAGDYFIRVRASGSAVGGETAGQYTVYVDRSTSSARINAASGPMFGRVNSAGISAAQQMISRARGDSLIRLSVPNNMAHESLFTAYALDTFTTNQGDDLDTRIEIFDADGNEFASDSEGGVLTNAYEAFAGDSNTDFYVRVRSDRITNGNALGTGGFTLFLDTAASSIGLDHVLRTAGIRMQGINTVTETQLFSFVPQTTGTSIISLRPDGAMPPVPDFAISLYDSDGNLIGFDDDFVGNDPQLIRDLEAGETYFIVVDSFDSPPGTTYPSSYGIRIEAAATLAPTADSPIPVDDHANTGDWDAATALVFNEPTVNTGPAGVIPGDFTANADAQGFVSGGGSPGADRSEVVYATGAGRIQAGGDQDVFVVIPPVDMLGFYEGMDDSGGMMAMPPAAWMMGLRPATRLQVIVRTDSLGFFQPTLRVFDSAVIRNPGAAPIYNSVDPFVAEVPGDPFAAVLGGITAGMLDPASWPPEMIPPTIDPMGPDSAAFSGEAAFGIEAWGGEPLFLEIAGALTGRYTVTVQADALPDEATMGMGPFGAGDHVDQPMGAAMPISGIREVPDEGEFNFAPEIPLTFDAGTPNSPGDGRTELMFTPKVNTLFDTYGSQSLVGFERTFARAGGGIAPSSPPGLSAMPGVAGMGVTVIQETVMPSLHSVNDTDLYFFRATLTGTVEVRLNTTDLLNFFAETIEDGTGRDPMAMPPDPWEITSNNRTKTYDSWLDGALRIFNADQQQIAYNDDNTAISGESDGPDAPEVFTGTFINDIFYRRDPRIVFEVTQGQIYYVQVESGQRQAWQSSQLDPTVAVDWKHAYGTYDLLINAMPELNGDDHEGSLSNPAQPTDITFGLGTPIPLNDVNGNGSLPGRIETRVVGADQDLFEFIAPASGIASVTVARTVDSVLNPTFRVIDPDANEVLNAAGVNGTAQGTFPVDVGSRYQIIVGGGGTVGKYTVSVNAPNPVDDFGDFGKFETAFPIPLSDHLGGASVNGNIEEFGDTDLFSFSAFDFQTMSISVTSTSILNPVLEVYELSVDPLQNVTLLRIHRNDDLSGIDQDSSVVVGVNADRVTNLGVNRDQDTTTATTMDDLNKYFVVVRGSNPEQDAGTYRLDISFPPIDDHPDLGEPATQISIPSDSGFAVEDGEIERVGDTDAFFYIAPAGGIDDAGATITISSFGVSSLIPRLRIVGSDGMTLINAVETGLQTISIQFDVERGQSIGFVVDASPMFAGTMPQMVGGYTVSIQTPRVDDHANETEFGIATAIVLDPDTGMAMLGSDTPGADGNPRIGAEDAGDPFFHDTDLFTFETILDGNVMIEVDPLTSTPESFTAVVTVFDSSFNVVAMGTGAGPGSAVQLDLNGTLDGDRFYVLVEDDDGFTRGEYKLTIVGPEPDPDGGGGNPDDPSDDIDFNNPTQIALAERNGDAERNSAIDEAGDRDLFKFTVPEADRTRQSRVFVQVVTPEGSILDASVTVLDQANENPNSVIAFDSGGIPGATASVSFLADPGQMIWVIVDGIGAGVGSYTVRIDAEPEVFELAYPEGFASAAIREFVSIANGNDYPVSYTVKLRYETGERDATVATNVVLQPGARGGVTLSNGDGTFAPGVRANEPYSIIIESDGPLGATLSRYDFNSANGDAFTETYAPSWAFATIERVPGSVFDFVVFYNPNDFDVDVTFTAFLQDGTQAQFTQTVEAQRRGGWNINAIPSLPVGSFGATVSAQAADPANDGAFEGIAAALSHFDQAATAGFGLLGDHQLGTFNVVTSITQGDGVNSQVAIFNPNNSPATVQLTGKYIRAALPELNRTIEIPAGRQVVLSGTDLGLIANQPAGLELSSNVPVTVIASEDQFGEGNGVTGTVAAAQSWFFGDAFINSIRAGETYFEFLTVYNPAAFGADVTIELLFTDGTSSSINLSLDARGFGEVRLHERPEILNRPDPLSFFSINITAPTPVTAGFVHYDLFLDGGFGNLGSPLGLTNPLSTIV